MINKARVPIAVLIILILASLFLTGGIYYLLQKERVKNLTLNEELTGIKTEQRITETKLAESQKTVSNLELKLQETQAQIDSLTVNLEQEKIAKQEASGQIEQLKTDLERQKSLRSDLENRLIQTQTEAKKTQALLNDLQSKKSELETKIKDLEARLQQQAQVQQEAQGQGVELGTIVVSPDATAPAQKTTAEEASEIEQKASSATSPEGKILVVNKDYNFAVINLGSKDGIEIGNTFSVYHNNKYLGDLKVGKVHDSMAAADFVSLEMKDKINEGDKVVQKTK